MSGYDGWSMSNNARDAYAAGEMPASRIAAATGLTTAEVRSFCAPCAWHHTSKKFNRTDFYALEDVLDAALERPRQVLNLRSRPKLRSTLIRYVQSLRRAAALFRQHERLKLRRAADTLILALGPQPLALPPAPAEIEVFKSELPNRRRDSLDQFRRQWDRLAGERVNLTLLACGIKSRSGSRLRRKIDSAIRREFNAQRQI